MALVPALIQTSLPRPKYKLGRLGKKVLKRVAFLGLAAYFIPAIFLGYLACGIADVVRNRHRTFGTIDRYFAGNGFLTWMLSPINLLLDLLTLPFINKGIYKLEDLPPGYQAEIQTLIDAAHRRDLIGALQAKMGENKRGMFFFQWYGKMMPSTIDIPEFQHKFKYLRTIGVSIFNKKQSTGKHFGPLRITLRVLYNINPIDSRKVYINVGNHNHYWQDQQLFIFDDTLQHQSCNESDGVRYCLFVDILRPSLVPWLLSGMVTATRLIMAPFRAAFYGHWRLLK